MFPALIMSGHWNQDGEAKMRNTGKTGDLIPLENLCTPTNIYHPL